MFIKRHFCHDAGGYRGPDQKLFKRLFILDIRKYTLVTEYG